jgi:hypothetical protein
MRAFPATAPPKFAVTETTIDGVVVVAVHFSDMFPDVPTFAGIAGAENVPVTVIGVDGTVTSDVQVAPTFASESAMMRCNFKPSTSGLDIGAITEPTLTSVVLATELTVQLIAEEFMSGVINCDQFTSGVISPAPVGRGGSALTNFAGAIPTADSPMTVRRMATRFIIGE